MIYLSATTNAHNIYVYSVRFSSARFTDTNFLGEIPSHIVLS